MNLLNTLQGTGAPADVHPDHLKNADASRVNHTQRTPYESREILEDIPGYDLVDGSLDGCIDLVRACVSSLCI
jgi:hypothetical protein